MKEALLDPWSGPVWRERIFHPVGTRSKIANTWEVEKGSERSWAMMRMIKHLLPSLVSFPFLFRTVNHVPFSLLIFQLAWPTKWPATDFTFYSLASHFFRVGPGVKDHHHHHQTVESAAQAAAVQTRYATLVLWSLTPSYVYVYMYM